VKSGWIGVRRDFPVDTRWLKKAALLFDRIDFPSHEAFFNTASLPRHHPACEELITHALAEYDWLARAGVIDLPYGPELQELRLQDFVDICRSAPFASEVGRASEAAARHWAAQLRKADVTAVAIAKDFGDFETSVGDGASDRLGTVIRVIMHEVPEPSEETSWEQIIEFRNTPETEARMAGLRRWMSEIATKGLESSRMADELQYLLHEYEQYMRVQKMKILKGPLETILTVSGEIAESLAKVQWGRLGKLPFVIRQRRIQLLEAELSAPGREIGWLTDVRDWSARNE